ncbi:MAG: GatB/YqeY domain-containing protein [Oscillospiraceae bacterium]|nr:GatB/YqeY domain-containing protein [Oscillospiraceae bacterium]
MNKMEQVRAEMFQAMKDKNAQRKADLSSLLSALKAKWKDKNADLTEEEENAVVLKELKQTQETLATTPADRTDIIAECEARIATLKEFAPQQMGEAEIKAIIAKVLAEMDITSPTPQQKGLIMKNLMPLVKGKADGSLVNKLVADLFA